MERITQKHITGLVKRLNIALDRPTAHNIDGQWTDGHLYVEQSGSGKGYNLVKSRGSAIRRVLFYGETRSDIYHSIQAMLTGIEYAETSGYYSQTQTKERGF